MRLDNRRRSTNVEDRRGMGMGGKGAIGGRLGIFFIAWLSNICLYDGTGIRFDDVLKIHWEQLLAGSTPATNTNKRIDYCYCYYYDDME